MPRASKRLLVPAALLVIAVAMVCGRAAMRKRRLMGLFKAQARAAKAEPVAFYPKCRFGSGGATGLDAITGATSAMRMRSPSVYREARPSQQLQVTYPPEGALFPANLCAPYVEWDDAQNDLWLVRITVDGGQDKWEGLSRGRRWRIPRRAWEALKREAVNREAIIQVLGTRRATPDAVIAAKPVRVRISPDPIDDYLVYRLVTPPFSPQSTPDTFVRDVRTMRAEPFLLGRGRYCFNCHRFSSSDGSRAKLSIQSRYFSPEDVPLKVYLSVYDIGARRGSRLKLPFTVQMTTFTAWSRDGAWLAVSANQQLATVPPVVFETQRVSMPTSDIAVYNVGEGAAHVLPGAADPSRLEVYPCWTPDSQSLVFASAPTPRNPLQRTHYGLHVVPFNGGRGGEPRGIPGASQAGKSHYFPRFSPDGKWLSFCRSDGGALIRSSSDLWLMPAGLSGGARALESNAPHAADSWHSWSANSRWLVFASKRDDGIYARLYFTHIDDAGRASPAVRLPVSRLPLASFNIPESLAQRPAMTEGQLYAAIRVGQTPRVVKLTELK